VAHYGSAGRGHCDVAAGPHKATDQPQILQLTGPRLEAEIGIVPRPLRQVLAQAAGR
jgi:hypothetical protein